jgi:hypothetical protein
MKLTEKLTHRLDELGPEDSYKLFDYYVEEARVPAPPKGGMRQALTHMKVYTILRNSDGKKFEIRTAAKFNLWVKRTLKLGKNIKVGNDKVLLPKGIK